MKKLFLLATLVISASSAMAQRNERSWGGQLLLDDQLGIGVKYRHGLTDKVRLEGSFNAYLPEHSMSTFSINANAQYLFPVAPRWTVYPLAGLNYIFTTGNGYSNGDFGINLGCGGDYKLTNRLNLTLEAKFQIGEGTNFVPAVGVAYKF